MSYCGHWQEKWMRVSGRMRTRNKPFLDPQGLLLRRWNMIFAVSCVVAVSMDPLFLYLPILDGDNKCVWLDKRLKIVAITLRSVTDFIYFLNIILQFICPYIDENSQKLGRTRVVTNPRQIAKRYVFSRYFVIDVLAILPLPQVLIPHIFSKRTSSKFFNTKNFLNAIVVLQYIPRVLRIHLSWKIHTRSGSKPVRIVSVEAAYNLFLYALASHVLGALWYFFSIEKAMICWQIACESHIGCTTSAFRCDQSLGNYTFLNDYCPVNPPNITLFDFGIFLQALQSGIIVSTNFQQKISYCFWWGLRNLSSLGQNLQTSTAFWENCFAVSISISGLLLFLYLIGNLQIYMQLEIFMWLENEKSKKNMKGKQREIELWIYRNELPSSIKQEIMPHVQHMPEEKEDVHVQNLLPHLPIQLGRKIKRHICMPMLKKVPLLLGNSETLLLLICDYLKPMHYNQHSYIVREGEPLDTMLFITKGIIWDFTTSNGERSAKRIEKGSFYGEELIDWGLYRHNEYDIPISSRTVKTHTKVEAFALMATDLTTIVSKRIDAARAIHGAFCRFQQMLYSRRRSMTI